MKVALILRKKIEGENSLEELAKTIADQIPEVSMVYLPYDSYSLHGILGNIQFIKRLRADVYHVFSTGEGYLVPFIRKKCILKMIFQWKCFMKAV